MRLGLRAANQKFSAAMKTVRAGEEVVLTDRGRPVAVITPLVGRSGAPAMLARLAQAGLLRLPQVEGRLPPARPVRSAGPAASQVLSAERGQR
jgi:prevent-host-death family protein